MANIIRIGGAGANVEKDDVFGTLIHHIDFTDGVYKDKFAPKGTAVLASGVTASANGITVNSQSDSYVTLPEFGLLNGDTVVFDFGAWAWDRGSNNGRLLMFSDDGGLVYQGASVWNVYAYGWGTGFQQTNRNYFSNSKMGIKFVDDGTIIIYKDGVIEGTITNSHIWQFRQLTNGASYFRINSAAGSGVSTVTIKSIKVYRGG
jgi:hypothetical protein